MRLVGAALFTLAYLPLQITVSMPPLASVSIGLSELADGAYKVSLCDRYADGSCDNLEFQSELGVQSQISFCDPLCFPPMAMRVRSSVAVRLKLSIRAFG